MKALKKALVALLGAVLGCCFFVGCLSTKLSVTYVVDGETYRVQEYEMDTQIALPTPPTKAGYTFIGWYTDEALTVPYAEGKVGAGMTLYAKFTMESVYIIINANGGEKMDPVEVAPGADYTLPEAVKEGHTFLGYTYVDENGDEQEFPLSGKYPNNVSIRITAKFEINKYTVTFVGMGEQEVNYGSVAVAPNAEKAGYAFDGWYTSETEQTEETKFDLTTAIKEDITLYAKYSPKSYTITVNGAQAGYVNPSVVYGEEYSLVAPEIENFEFVKFTMNGKDFPATGTYTWTEDIAVDAVWDGEGKFIWFYDGATELSDLRIITEYEADLTSIRLHSVPAKDGYSTDGKWYTDAECTQEFVAEGKVADNIRLYAKYTANEYTVTFLVWDKATKAMKSVPVTVTYGQTIANVPEMAERDAYDFKGYFLGDDLFDMTKPYTYTQNITVEEKWVLREDASLFEYNQSGNYFTERNDYDADWTYVYLVGETYTFAETAVLTMVTAGGDAFADVAGNTMTVKAPGEFVVSVNNNGTVYERTFKTVAYVKSFSLGGTGYDAAWGVEDGDYKRNSTGVWDKVAKVEDGETMKVGKTNFIPEISINGKVTAFDTASINVTVTVDGAETKDYTVANGAINFGNGLVGKEVAVTLAPKYAVNVAHKATYNVTVNNGANVYTNEEMKTAFANADVSEINVLRNIKAELSEDQQYTFTVDGWTITSPKNDGSEGYESTGVYERRTGDLKVNGNYFNVDGSKLPLVDVRNPNETYNSLTSNPDLSTYTIVDARFAIFTLGIRHQLNDTKFAMENLNIICNGDMDASKSIEYKNRTVLVNSGAAIGVSISGGYLDMNNVTTRFGSFGILASTGTLPTTATRNAAILTAKDCKIEKNWSNNIYCGGFVKVTLDSCFLGSANGAAIHYDAKANTAAVDGELNLVGDTDIQNWVTGQEAWFVAQGAGVAVQMVQSMVEPGVQTATNKKKTISKEIDGAVKSNFAIVMRARRDTSAWSKDDKRGENWMADITDATYRGYLQQSYVGQGAMAFGGKALDVMYLGFMQEMAKAGAYTTNDINAYCGANAAAKYARASTSDLGDYMEIYVEMVNA